MGKLQSMHKKYSREQITSRSSFAFAIGRTNHVAVAFVLAIYVHVALKPAEDQAYKF